MCPTLFDFLSIEREFCVGDHDRILNNHGYHLHSLDMGRSTDGSVAVDYI